MQRVLILGATSAVAAEAAVLYARRGDRLHLVGRNPEKLAAVAARCAPAEVTTATADFGLLDANAQVIDACFAALGEVDVALIAHGDLGDQLATEQGFEAAEAVLRTNFVSVVSLLIPLANRMESARHGRVGVITSVAAERGRPRNYTYGAAKGALNTYLQGLRTRLYPSRVTVTTIKLGPVDSPMTATHAKHPLFGQPASVARDLVRAIDRGTPEAFVPGYWALIMPVVRAMPERLFQVVPFLSGR